MKFKVGDVVMLIGCDDFMPPIGAIGEVIGWDWQGGLDYEVRFDKHPCPVPPGEWYIPPYWLMRIDPRESGQTSTGMGEVEKLAAHSDA